MNSAREWFVVFLGVETLASNDLGECLLGVFLNNNYHVPALNISHHSLSENLVALICCFCVLLSSVGAQRFVFGNVNA